MTTEGLAVRPTRLGKYELITRIGQGGMAEVQLAIQRGPAGFEKLVVVKLVHENLATQKAFVDMLLDEARVAALVKHPNVVDIYDLGEVGGRFFIAMEYLEGEPLLSVLRAGREGKRLDVMSTTRLIANTAEGLDAAHELRTMGGEPLQLVHHDVSLGNIVVLYNGQVKLVDFGVAKATQTVGQHRRVQGKFSYMSPEKLHGAAGDRRSDIWSLGVVLWEALTLRRLFRGGNDSDTMRQVLDMPLHAPSAVNADCPAELDPIVMRALERNPDHRYATAKELADDLEDVLTAGRYGARNDLISRYMQETFQEHIVARKKLLQEVSSKGTASTEIIDEAFSDTVVAAGSGPGQKDDFAVKFRANTTGAHGLVREEGSQPSALLATPAIYGMAGPPALDPTADVPPFDTRSRRSQPMIAASLGEAAAAVEAATAAARQSSPTIPTSFAGNRAGTVPGTGTGTARLPVPRTPTPLSVPIVVPTGSQTGRMATVGTEPLPVITSPRLEPKKPRTEPRAAVAVVVTPQRPHLALVLAIGAVVVAGGAVATYLLTRGDPPRAEPTPAPAVDPPPAPPPQPAPPAAPAASLATATSRAEALYLDGSHQLDAGDATAAAATLRRAEDADPAFAPSYRVLGLALERIGDKAAEKAQFVKYLQLAPNAADAPRIRDKLAGL